jgi:hypothetical protein
MAKQIGIVKLIGTLGDITFTKTKDGYIAKTKSVTDSSKIFSDVKFQRTRENMSEFGRAGKSGKVLRDSFRSLLKNAKDNRVTSRLTSEMITVFKSDTASIRGDRNAMSGNTELLQGFDFNNNAKLSTTFHAPYASTIDRVAGTLKVIIPGFVPQDMIVAPSGATHYKIVSAGSEVDFRMLTFIADEQESGILPLDNNLSAALNLVNTVSANSTSPLFLLLGIQFFQQVNGVDYPLSNGAFNTLNMIKVNKP